MSCQAPVWRMAAPRLESRIRTWPIASLAPPACQQRPSATVLAAAELTNVDPVIRMPYLLLALVPPDTGTARRRDGASHRRWTMAAADYTNSLEPGRRAAPVQRCLDLHRGAARRYRIATAVFRAPVDPVTSRAYKDETTMSRGPDGRTCDEAWVGLWYGCGTSAPAVTPVAGRRCGAGGLLDGGRGLRVQLG